MTIYYLLLAGVVAGGVGFCSIRPNRWTKLAYTIMVGTILTALAGVRFLTGHDYALYWPTFVETYYLDWANQSDSLNRMEKGYLMVNRLLSNFSMEGYVIFFFFGLLYAVSVMWFLYRYSSNIWMGAAAFLCFGLYFNSFCFMRQYAAAMILMWALIDIKESRPLRFLVLVFLASAFHLSALIFLPFYIILKIPLNRMVLSVYTLGGILCYAFSDRLYQLAGRLYYQREVSLNSLGVFPWPSIGFIELLLLCILWRSALVKKNSFNSILINCLFFGTFFELLGIKYHIISRVAILFMTPAIILLAGDLVSVMAQSLQETKYGKRYPNIALVTAYALFLLAMAGFYGYLMHINYNGVVPYRTIAEIY